MTPEQLMEIPGIGEKMVEKIQLAVAAHFQSLENQQAETAKRWKEPRPSPNRRRNRAKGELAAAGEEVPGDVEAAAEAPAESEDGR